MPEQFALRTWGGGVSLTWDEYGEMVRCYAAGLAGLGTGHGDKVAPLLTNRPGGKNLSPAAIEGAVKVADRMIGYVVAIGDQRPYVVALITLEPDAAAAFAAEHGIAADPAVLAKDPRVIERIGAAVRAANTRLARVEQIKKFRVLPEYWEPGSDLLTPTMKLRRKPIAAAYAAEIDSLYEESAR